MKLVYNKKSPDPFYYIQHGYRIGEKVKTVTICKLGRHSELAKIYPNPLEYALSVLKQYQNDYNSTKDEKGEKLSRDNKDNQRIIKSNAKNIGYIYLQHIYHLLNLDSYFEKIAEDRKYLFDSNEINRFLTFDRILEPHSKLATVNNLHKYFENPEFTHQQVLRFMDVLSANYDSYLDHLYKNSNNIVKRDTSVCYYDCTNYYFEIETADKCVDDVTGEIIYGLRQYGINKEHRPNPIVEMGLFMDKNGIPITMGIFPGNTNEQVTATPLETKMTKILNGKNFIYCGDAGLGSASIRVFNSIGGRAFIVTQSIKKLSDELKEKVFKDEEYKLLSSDEPITLKELMEFNKYDETKLALYEDKAYKSIFVDSNVELGLYEEKTLKNGKKKIVKSKGKLEQRIIITYSRKAAEYQKKIRNKQIERAKALISKGKDDIRKGPNDIARFIKKKNDVKDEYILDEELIANEAKFDGFYALATNLLLDSAQDIIEVNSQRWKIEDCFRVLKTNFDTRPVYHRLDPRIVAHFMICYTALLIYRLLEVKLKEKGYNYTINEIISSLKNIEVFEQEGKYFTTYNYGEILSALNDTFDVDIDSKYFMSKDLNKLIKKNI